MAHTRTDQAKHVLWHVNTHFLSLNENTGWGKSGVTVVPLENNTIINKQ